MARAFVPHATHDPDADAIYVSLCEASVARSKQLDDCRIIDLAEDGSVVGIEFLGVGGGIDLSDIPLRDKVEELIGDLGLGIRIFV